jgi:hypothetical protein
MTSDTWYRTHLVQKVDLHDFVVGSTLPGDKSRIQKVIFLSLTTLLLSPLRSMSNNNTSSDNYDGMTLTSSENDDEMPLRDTQEKRTDKKRVAAFKAKPKAKSKARKSKAKNQELKIGKPDPLAAPAMSEQQRQPKIVSKQKAADVDVDDKAGEQVAEEASFPEFSPAKTKRKSSQHRISRSTKRGALKSYQEEDDDHQESDQENLAKNNNATNDEDADESFSPRPKTKKPKTTSSTSGTKPRDRGKEEDRTCPHCHKVYYTMNGLRYHVGTYTMTIGYIF